MWTMTGYRRKGTGTFPPFVCRMSSVTRRICRCCTSIENSFQTPPARAATAGVFRSATPTCSIKSRACRRGSPVTATSYPSRPECSADIPRRATRGGCLRTLRRARPSIAGVSPTRRRRSGTLQILPAKTRGTIEFNDRDYHEATPSAGGGWGDPIERDHALVIADIRDHAVSAAMAGAIYGVVANQTVRSTKKPPRNGALDP